MTFPNQTNKNKLLVFSTSVQSKLDVLLIAPDLNKLSKITRWCIDLNDWEKVLKIESNDEIKAIEVEQILTMHGYSCKTLDH